MKKGVVYGFGINDADYQVKPTQLIKGKYVIVGECPVYSTWKDLLRRCYSASFRKQKLYYANVTMDSSWHRFSVFKSWFDSVTGGNYYDIDNRKLRLDKDLLYPDNKHYSPSTCSLVSVKINNFILSGLQRESALPKGVVLCKPRGGIPCVLQRPL